MRNILVLFIAMILLSLKSFSQNTGWLNISAGVRVQFIVTDPLGRRTGEDPRGVSNPMQGRKFNEIPGANYSTSSVGDSPLEDYEPSPEDLQFEFGYKIKSPENDGTYSIETIGTELGIYSLSIDVWPRRGSTLQSFRQQIKGLTDKNHVTTFRFSYGGVVGTPITFEKTVVQQTLRQDLDNSFKLKLLGEQGFYKELSNSLDSYEKHLSKKDTLKAVKEVEKFQDRITGEYNKGTKPNDKRFITADAWKILYDDAQYLVAHLIQLPPKPVGLTVLRQLDSLKAEVQRQQSKMNLSGTMLVKGLLLSLDQAKKQLQQADSAKAAIAVRVFQLVVDETHELTDALLQKHKPLPSLYVKDEAYVQLHYRAKYILEALPEPRVDIHQHRLQMVDKELQKELDALKQMTEQK
jgi:hypothetical protein